MAGAFPVDAWQFPSSSILLHNNGSKKVLVCYSIEATGVESIMCDYVNSGANWYNSGEPLRRFYVHSGTGPDYANIDVRISIQKLEPINPPSDTYGSWDGWEIDGSYYCGEFSSTQGLWRGISYYYLKWPAAFEANSRTFEDDYWNLTSSEIRVTNHGPGIIKVYAINQANQLTTNQVSTIADVTNIWIDTPAQGEPGYGSFTAQVCVKPSNPGSIGSAHYLLDGNMEQQPISSYWMPDTSHGGSEFGRLNTSNLIVVSIFY
jgi:hypothetical protein